MSEIKLKDAFLPFTADAIFLHFPASLTLYAG